MLTEQDKKNILNEFPNIKLSYEKIIHKKVYPLNDDYLLIIPEGKKCFSWFTTFNDKPVWSSESIETYSEVSNIRKDILNGDRWGDVK